MLHGAQRGVFHLSFDVPSRCADRIASGECDIGIVPAIELGRQQLKMIPGLGIASHGPVRSVLMISRVPPREVRSLAADVSSRTSVALARTVLARRYNTEPLLVPMAPDLDRMLAAADAAVIIGDPAMQVDTRSLPWEVHDLGEEWWRMTGLPMVYAVWAGRAAAVTEEVAGLFRESYRFGRERLDDIVLAESGPRRLPEALTRDYLTRVMVWELGPAEYEGLNLFLQLAGKYYAAAPHSEKPIPT